MRTFQEFMTIVEAYDAAFMSGAQVRKTGEGGRVGSLRKKTAPEKRRMSQAKSGEERKPTEYKPRKDIGTQKATSTRVQQPEKERGSAALSPKEAQRKAYLERKSGKKAPTASELLKKKKTEVDKRPEGQPKRAVVGMSRAKRKDITRRGHRLAQELARQGEAERQGKRPEDIVLKKLTNAK
jgi:hypothetical protein